MLIKNKKILEARFPIVLERIMEAPDTNQKVIFQKGTDGFLNYKVIEDDKEYWGYYENNVTQTIDTWYRSFIHLKQYLLVITGFGLGYHIEKIIDNKNFNETILVIEKDPSFLRQVFERIDCSTLLSHPYFFLTTGEINQKMFRVFKDVHFNNLHYCEKITYTPTYYLNKDYYQTAFTELEIHFSDWRSNYFTNLLDGSLLQENIFKNIRYVINEPHMFSIKDTFKGRPFIIVSAGPSLDESIDFLRAAQNKAIIICVNSAYRKLIKSGIHPHFTAAIDPRHYTYEGYKGLPINKTSLICSYYVHPEVIQYFKNNPIFTYEGNYFLINYLYKKSKQPKYESCISELGTVAVTALLSAIFMNAKEIYFVGQDLAYLDSGKTHTGESIYKDYKILYKDIKNSPQTEGNTSEKVYTDNIMMLYKKTIEYCLEKYPDVIYYNTSKFGAKIEHTIYIDPEDATKKILEYEELQESPEKMIAQIAKNNRKYNPKAIQLIQEELKEIEKANETILNISLQALCVIEYLNQLKNTHAQHPLIAQLEIQSREYANSINDFLDNLGERYLAMVEGALKLELTEYYALCRHKETPKTLSEEATYNQPYFWALANGSSLLKNILNNT